MIKLDTIPLLAVIIIGGTSIEDTIETQLAVLYREVSPDSEVDLYAALCGLDADSVLIREVSLIQSRAE